MRGWCQNNRMFHCRGIAVTPSKLGVTGKTQNLPILGASHPKIMPGSATGVDIFPKRGGVFFFTAKCNRCVTYDGVPNIQNSLGIGGRYGADHQITFRPEGVAISARSILAGPVWKCTRSSENCTPRAWRSPTASGCVTCRACSRHP